MSKKSGVKIKTSGFDKIFSDPEKFAKNILKQNGSFDVKCPNCGKDLKAKVGPKICSNCNKEIEFKLN